MGGSVDGKEVGDEKQLNDEVVAFLRKRSETEGVCCPAKLKSYVKVHDKRKRAEAARRHVRGFNRYKNENESQNKNKVLETQDRPLTDRNLRSGNRSPVSIAPAEACGCGKKPRRRRRSCRRRRRRSCGRRRRRRRSCRRRRRRRSCRRRRRRSCSRRRRRNRRRSCRRRRRRCG